MVWPSLQLTAVPRHDRPEVTLRECFLRLVDGCVPLGQGIDAAAARDIHRAI